MKQTLLQVVAELAGKGAGTFQQGEVLRRAAERLGIRGQLDREQALLTVWSDLFREGRLAWGHNLINPDPPFLHVTDQGRETLCHLSRDPANPDGYLQYLADIPINPVADSYIREALQTYNASCIRATAVLVGVAAESLILEIRDKAAEAFPRGPKGLRDRWVKSVFDALVVLFAQEKKRMPAELAERVEAHLPGFAQQIRAGRNDAGHPRSIAPVTTADVHASLLIFPELARLAADIREWLVTVHERGSCSAE